MKSLLVDVLRQAKDGSPNRTLSDSGSYDTTQSEVLDTANDPLAAQDAGLSDEELKLYETSASLEAAFNQSANEDAADAGFDEDAWATDSEASRIATQTQMSATAPALGDAPAMARYAPLACIAAAFFAAALWIGYQHVALKYAASDVAVTQLQQRGDQAGVNRYAAGAETAQRFPFISAAIDASESGSDE
tara:strand:- start:14513 stop:15085 length:573 start_codon:yes stop_codon:yes gene_type:complete